MKMDKTTTFPNNGYCFECFSYLQSVIEEITAVSYLYLFDNSLVKIIIHALIFFHFEGIYSSYGCLQQCLSSVSMLMMFYLDEIISK